MEAGRQKGSRNKLGEAFVADVYNKWQKDGADVLNRMARDDPSGALCALWPTFCRTSSRLSRIALPISSVSLSNCLSGSSSTMTPQEKNRGLPATHGHHFAPPPLRGFDGGFGGGFDGGIDAGLGGFDGVGGFDSGVGGGFNGGFDDAGFDVRRRPRGIRCR